MTITSVSFTFENGVKREEYGPTRKASATITAGVDDGENGIKVLYDIANAARARVQDAIGAPQPPPMTEDIVLNVTVTAALPQNTAPTVGLGNDTSASATAASTASAEETHGQPASEQQSTGGSDAEPDKRKRRTKAEMEAARAAEAAAKNPGIESEGLPLGEQTSQPGPDGSQASDDPWAVAESEEVAKVTDEELTQACAAASQRVGSSDKVKAVIVGYKPTAEWPEGKPFSVKDIPGPQRAGFLKALADLK